MTTKRQVAAGNPPQRRSQQPPIWYTVNGKHLAIGVGNGGAQAMTFPPLVPEIQNADRGTGNLVFEIPDSRSAQLKMAARCGGKRAHHRHYLQARE